MTDVVDRHWGHSLVRAPTAKDAALPGSATRRPGVVVRPPTPTLAPVTASPAAATAPPLAEPTRSPAPSPPFRTAPPDLRRMPERKGAPTVSGTIPMSAWDAAAMGPPVGQARPSPSPAPPAPTPAAPAPPPPVIRSAPPANRPAAPALAVADPRSTATVIGPDASAVRIAPIVATPAPPIPGLPSGTDHRSQPPEGWPRTNGTSGTNAADDPSLARLARGIQDCARALACLADRLDGFERRLGSVGPPAVGLASPTQVDSAPPAQADLRATVRALEGMSADRLQTLDLRLRKLETLPATVSRLQKDTTLLPHLATTQKIDAADKPTTADTVDTPGPAPAYRTLDSATATQSLERVRGLERSVLDLRRTLERTLSDNSRRSMSEHTEAEARIRSLEARLAAVESPPTR